ncbi:MAG TPA: kelch repeat-containing protein, partial [Acidimicrobiales bacterium]|nr:kelch repeat-containing protein [Acidimicrobiales bacterium]
YDLESKTIPTLEVLAYHRLGTQVLQTLSYTLAKPKITTLAETASASGLIGQVTVSSTQLSVQSLEFSAEPSATATAGDAFDEQPVLGFSPANGPPAGSTTATSAVSSEVSLSLVGGTPGAKLTCAANPVTALDGVARFSGCSVNQAGAGYQLEATDGGLIPSLSTAFTVTEAAGDVGQAPVSTVGLRPASSPSPAPMSSVGAPALPAATQTGGYLVELQLAGRGCGLTGCLVTSAELSQPSSALGFDLSVDFPSATTALGELASVLRYELAGKTIPTVEVLEYHRLGTSVLQTLAYTLAKPRITALRQTAEGSGVIGQVTFSSTQVTVQSLDFRAEPSGSSTAGEAFQEQPVVDVSATSSPLAGPARSRSGVSSEVSLALVGGTPGAKLSCAANPVTAVDGLARFSGCSVNEAGTGYQLEATDAGLVPSLSSPFTVAQAGPLGDWSELSPATSPPPRLGAVMAYDPASQDLVLFGGETTGFAYLADTWTWDGTNWAEASPTTSPPPLAGASMAYDAASGQMILFGGYDNLRGPSYNETWSWDGSTWTELSPAHSPPELNQAAMAYDPATATIVMFGGLGAGGDLQGTWTWDGSDWTEQSPGTSPTPRRGASMAYDAATTGMVLSGGFDDSRGKTLDDTWIWDGSDWTEQSPSTPAPEVTGASMCYDPTASVVLLFGGEGATGTYAQGTWTWDGSDWTEQSPSRSPDARAAASMAYDEAGTGETILFGGNDDNPLADTWSWSYPSR